MPIHEAVRRVLIGRWYAVVLPILLCVGVTVGVELARAQPTYEATARIQASATPPSSTVEADSVLSRVTGVATSRSEILGAMRDAKVTNRSPVEIARKAVTVTRIGSSAVFDLSVADTDPRVARALTQALADRLVRFLSWNGGGQVAELTKTLQRKLNAAQVQRAQMAKQQQQALSPVDKADLEAAVTALDQQIATTSATLGNLDIATATTNSAALISEAGAPAVVPRHLLTDIALAFCLGLALGLLLASLLELLRPRAADGEAAAQYIGADMLGTVDGPSGSTRGDLISPTTLLGLRTAVARSGARTLVVTGSCAGRHLVGLQRELARALSRGDVIPGATGAPGRPTRPPPSPAPSASGMSPLTRARSVNGTPRGATTVLPRSGEQAGTEASPVRVVRLGETSAITTDAVLVYAARPLTPYRDLVELKNLAAATGWPVLGVLEVGRRPTGGQPR